MTTPEKAAPILAKVAALAWRVVDTLWMGSHEKTDARRTIEREVMALLADRASQEERIREDERDRCLRGILKCEYDGVGLTDCIDNDGKRYPSQELTDFIKAAEEVLADRARLRGGA